MAFFPVFCKPEKIWLVAPLCSSLFLQHQPWPGCEVPFELTPCLGYLDVLLSITALSTLSVQWLLIFLEGSKRKGELEDTWKNKESIDRRHSVHCVCLQSIFSGKSYQWRRGPAAKTNQEMTGSGTRQEFSVKALKLWTAESVTNSLCYFHETSQGEMKTEVFPYSSLWFRYYLISDNRVDNDTFALRGHLPVRCSDNTVTENTILSW